MSFEKDMESSLSKIKASLAKQEEGAAEADQTIVGQVAKGSYRPAARRIFPLKSTYQKMAAKLHGRGMRQEAKEATLAHKAKLQNADAKIWAIKGRPVNRYQMMVHIIEEMSAGMTMKKLSEQPGHPAVGTMISWKEEHPDFKLALDLAKKVQAQVFADEALDTMRSESDPKAAALAKNKHDALMKRAALQSVDFRERQPAPADPEPTDIKAMQEQLLALLADDNTLLPPHVAQIVRDAIAGKQPALTITLASED